MNKYSNGREAVNGDYVFVPADVPGHVGFIHSQDAEGNAQVTTLVHCTVNKCAMVNHVVPVSGCIHIDDVTMTKKEADALQERTGSEGG